MWKWNMRNGYRLLHTTEYLDEICKKYQFPSYFTCLCFAWLDCIINAKKSLQPARDLVFLLTRSIKMYLRALSLS